LRQALNNLAFEMLYDESFGDEIAFLIHPDCKSGRWKIVTNNFWLNKELNEFGSFQLLVISYIPRL